MEGGFSKTTSRDSDLIGLRCGLRFGVCKTSPRDLNGGYGGAGEGPLPQANSLMSLALVSSSVIRGVECVLNRIFPVLHVLKTISKYLQGNGSTFSP